MAVTDRVLLLGGPFHFRTVKARPTDFEILLALPTVLPLTLDPYEVQSLDLQVARYIRGQDLIRDGQILGVIYDYQETR